MLEFAEVVSAMLQGMMVFCSVLLAMWLLRMTWR
jgi:hypothetical protein